MSRDDQQTFSQDAASNRLGVDDSLPDKNPAASRQVSLEELRLPQLKALASQLQIPGGSRMSKANLIEAILKYRSDAPGPSIQGQGAKPRAQRAKPILVRIYLDSDDAVTAVRTLKAVNDLLEGAGYGKTKIDQVVGGSIRIRLRAWLDGDNGQKAQQFGKQKLGEAAGYAEQWAKDATVNRPRAEISSINAKTTALLTDALKDVDNAALQMDEWLIVKYKDARGESCLTVRKLTITDLLTLERNPAILSDPRQVIEKLALLSYVETDNDATAANIRRSIE